MLLVYNTLTRKKEEFKPVNPPFVGMYVCGPTVYDDPHLGHAKSYISFDVINRFLRAAGFTVRYVQNITDVGHLLGEGDDGEDRVERRARLEKLEPVEIAQKYEHHYFRDMDALNCLRPDISCRATGYILDMIRFVERLLEKGAAYEAAGNVYFDISTFPDYGKLSGRKLDELQSGTRVEVAEGKRHPADFALWKRADTNHLMQWPSPWGQGFPGWHLECSVMSMKYIGDTLDIHGGGIDNQFPHHECEIAQSESLTGKPFVKYWLHNNMVTVEGQKMSKSLGNFITLEDLFKKYDPMTVRFFVLQGHYRSPQDFSDEALEAARKGFEKLTRTVQAVKNSIEETSDQGELSEPWLSLRNKFISFMEDDFGTAGAISVLFDAAREANNLLSAHVAPEQLCQAATLFADLGEKVLGLDFSASGSEADASGLAGSLINMLIEQRNQARETKDWIRADVIRDRLAERGVILEDSHEGTTWHLQ